jgi:hypothetical protein
MAKNFRPCDPALAESLVSVFRQLEDMVPPAEDRSWPYRQLTVAERRESRRALREALRKSLELELKKRPEE